MARRRKRRYYDAVKEVPIGMLFNNEEIKKIRQLVGDGYIYNLNNEDAYYEGKGFAHSNSDVISDLISRLYNLEDTYNTSLAIDSLIKSS